MPDLEALIDAAKSGDLEGVRRIAESNPSLTTQRLPSGASPLMAALYLGHHAVVDALISLGADVDVFAAAATGRVAELGRVLAQPGAVNAFSYDGWTPLHLAAFFGHREAATVLLDAGADVHAVSRNSLRNTPLHAATAGKHSDVALLLLRHGADERALDAGGHTPARIAEENQLTAVLAAIAAKRG